MRRSDESAAQIDAQMERASEALVACDYFRSERLCIQALAMARRTEDFERMARICLPLQEARRQKRDTALDAGPVALVAHPHDMPSPLRPGCYLVRPPMVGRDGAAVRESLDRRGVPACVLTREPLTRAGRWPIVAAGPMVVRVQVDPPWPVERVETSPAKDDETRLPPAPWFASASEALGDAAIAALDLTDHPHHVVDDLLDFLSAHPEHEKLHQALEAACRRAIGAEPPVLPRRRGLDDPTGF